MKLAISNLSWESKYDDLMFQYLYRHGIALEVVPSRIFKWEESSISNRQVSPFEHFSEAADWYRIVNTHYGINVASMHSLLYNIDKNLFETATYRRYLTDYLQRAIQFAARINCPNLCFGCALNRKIPDWMTQQEALRIAEDFFGDLAVYAYENGICLSLEPVPKAEGTNFLNTTQEALEFVRNISNPGLRVCVSLGTIIENNEDISKIFTKENINLINHIHISEPGLAPLEQREIDVKIAQLLKELDYNRYVSVEMLSFPDVKLIQGAVNYFETLFLERSGNVQR